MDKRKRARIRKWCNFHQTVRSGDVRKEKYKFSMTFHPLKVDTLINFKSLSSLTHNFLKLLNSEVTTVINQTVNSFGLVYSTLFLPSNLFQVCVKEEYIVILCCSHIHHPFSSVLNFSLLCYMAQTLNSISNKPASLKYSGSKILKS